MSLLSLIIATPLIGALISLLIPNTRVKLIQGVALVFSAIALLLSGYLYAAFDKAITAMQFVERLSWIPAFNITYYVGIDGLSVALVVLTALLTLLAIVYSFNITLRVKEFFFWFLLLEAGMLGVFVSLDFFLFYVFWELTLVPMYFLIGIWGGPKKEYAAIKFFLFTLFGSLFMLLGILALYFYSAPHTFDMLELIKQGALLPKNIQIWIFLALYLGFAIKIPAFPFHTWLPLAHVEAPTGVSVILAGVLLKMGTYGIMRVSFAGLPQATQWFMPFLIVIAVINIVYGAFCAMAQKDLKKMVAYSSVNHMGYCMLGMTAMSGIGWNGAVLQMITHGLITGSLFFLVGVIYDRAHTRDIDAFGGLGAKFPIYAGLMIVQVMASLGLPGLAGFVGEFLCFLGAFNSWPYYVGVATIGILVTAAFFLRMIEKVFLGPFNEKWAGLKDINFREMVAIVPLVVLTIVIGVWPKFCLDLIDPTINAMLALIK